MDRPQVIRRTYGQSVLLGKEQKSGHSYCLPILRKENEAKVV